MSESTRRTAGVPEYAYSDFRPGQRVMTVDKYPGRIISIDEGPASNNIHVVLDNGMGGGMYDDSMLSPLNTRSSSVDRTASDDYPELGGILTDRPDLAPVLSEAEYLGGRRVASLSKQADYFLDTPASRALSAAAAELLSASNAAQHRVVSDLVVVPEHLADIVVSAAMVHCETCDVDYAIDSEDEKHDHSKTADYHLLLPPRDAETGQGKSQAYKDGAEQAHAGGAREPKSPGDAAYMADFSLGWAHGIEGRPNNPEIPLTDPSDLVDDTLDPDKVASKTAGIIDFLQGDDAPSKTWEGPGHNYSFDWCRFRKNSRCMFPKELNKPASELAGYAVWVPEDRGYCPRVSWDDQKDCPVSEPGPNAPGGYTDATVAWEDGGQRGGVPQMGYHSSKTAAADSDGFSFHFTAAWSDVRKKAKRIRQDGGVRVLSSLDGDMTAQVKGDHHVYQTRITSVPGRLAVGSWECGCPWAAYSWGRTGPWKKYEGRMCSHALAAVYEAQSRGMFGKSITEDEAAPAWVPKGGDVKVPGDWDRDLGAYTSAKSDQWELVALLVASGRPIAQIHPTVMAMALDSGHVVGSAGPLSGQVGGRVRDLLFEDGEVVDVATGTKIPGKVLYPSYDPRAGLTLTSTKEAPMGAEHWAMTFEPETQPTAAVQTVAVQRRSALADSFALSFEAAEEGKTSTCAVCSLPISIDSEGEWSHGPDRRGLAFHAPRPRRTADLHEEPEAALPTTDGSDDAELQRAAAVLRAAAISSETCPGCGLSVPILREDPDHCPQCGARMEGGEDDDEQKAYDDAAKKRAQGVSVRGDGCPKCKAKVKDSDKFCRGCGHALSAKAEPQQSVWKPWMTTTTSAAEAQTPEQVDAAAAWHARQERTAAGLPVDEAKDPHSWLMAGSEKSSDVAAMAQAFLASKTALKDFSAAERKSIIDEGEGALAGNFAGLDLTGTHYQALEQAQAALPPNDSFL